MSAPTNSPEMPSPLHIRLDAFRNIGPERAAQFVRMGLATVEDLLLHRPRRYEDRRRALAIRDLRLDEAGTFRGRVVAMGVRAFRRGAKSAFEMVVEDETGRAHCRWWNLPFMQNYFRVGEEVFVYGKPVSMRPRMLDHPETEVVEEGVDNQIHLNRIVPIYPLTEGLPQRWLRNFIWQKLVEFGGEIREVWPGVPIEAPFDRADAVRRIHFPVAIEDIERARQRLALDEFTALQLQLKRRRLNLELKSTALPCAGDNRWIKPFLASLGFRLTAGQTGVLKEIRHDMGGAHPMRRLLQGDVGCGKTVVAACTALMALESGYSVALMAPTEILAGQHHANLARWFAGLGIRVRLRTGQRKGRRNAAADTSVEPQLWVGTHALLEESVDIPRLGLVVIDEQHKFGVAQRETLLRKGRFPHLLVMTATPIPRTLGLSLYGDLDISVISHPPAGRGEVRTYVREESRLPKVWEFVRAKIQAGRQVYVVYPRVEDDGRAGVKAVTAQHAKLQRMLAPARVGLLYGRLKAEEKQLVVDDFRAGRIQVLAATTVIEVGIDVANATVMVIENAEQFGLAQLHQLRGRIGRGEHESFCILCADMKTDGARERLRILEETRDGFKIAEADLMLRGPGDLVGREQSGIPDFRFGDLRYDFSLVERSRRIADQIQQQAPRD